MKSQMVMVDTGRARVHARMPRPPKSLPVVMWTPEEDHPLGGLMRSITLIRRVNLRKDVLPQWMTTRPLYEYVRN